MFEAYFAARSHSRNRPLVRASLHASAMLLTVFVVVTLYTLRTIEPLPRPAFVAQIAEVAPPPPPPPPPKKRSRKTKKRTITKKTTPKKPTPKPTEVAVVEPKPEPEQPESEPEEPEEVEEDPEGAVENGVEGGVAGGTVGGVHGGVIGGLVGGQMQHAKMLVKPQRKRSGRAPSYPATARAQGRKATVVAQVCIDATGNVTAVRILAGPPPFDESVRSAVQHWEYESFQVDDTPIPVCFPAYFNFNLRKS